MKKIVLTSLVVLPLALFSQTLDQSQMTNSDPVDFFSGEPGESVYQSFTAGVSGQLTAVKLSFEVAATETLTVDIYAGAFEDNNLGETALGSSTVRHTKTGIVEDSVVFAGVEVVSGMKYSIKITSKSSISNIQGTVDDSYGSGVHTDVFGNTENTGDLYFETFVTEGPVTDVSQSLVGVGFSVYPNPTSAGIVKFNSVVNNVQVYNVKGELKMNVAETDELNVSGLDAGLYNIKTNQGSVKLVIQ